MKQKIIPIIKAQLSYLVYNLNSTFIIFGGVILYAYFRKFNPLNLLCFLLFVNYVSAVLLKYNKECRDYLIRLLSLTARDVAIMRIALVFLGFIFIYLIGTGLHLFIFEHAKGFRDGYHELFMFGGIGLFGSFFYLFATDSVTLFRSKSGYIWYNIFLASIILILSFFIILFIVELYESSALGSIQVILLLYLVSLAFGGLSFITYQKRESYLGYK